MNSWSIIQTDTFARWYAALDVAAREDIYRTILILKEFGPSLGRPYADTVAGSRHKNMKELRVQSRGRPFRIFFAFDQKRNGVLLIGGKKTGDKRFYERMVVIAERLLDRYMEDCR